MHNPPPKLLSPAPRNISTGEDFLGRSRFVTWSKALMWPLVAAVVIAINAYQGEQILTPTIILFGVLTIAGVVHFMVYYTRFKKTVQLLNDGILCNGYVQYYASNFLKGTIEFEMIYTHPLSGITYKGTVGMSFYNKLKYPMPLNSAVPLIIDPLDPGKFTIYIPQCGLHIGKSAPF